LERFLAEKKIVWDVSWSSVTPMCENLSCVRSARLAAAGKEGVEIWLQEDRGTRRGLSIHVTKQDDQ